MFCAQITQRLKKIYSEKLSGYVAQDGLKLITALLRLPPKWWDSKHVQL